MMQPGVYEIDGWGQVLAPQRRGVVEEFRQFTREARAPRLRSMRQFAESEIVIPDGRFKGRKFNAARQPWTVLWFAAIASALWRRHFLTGPSQAGKTLCGYVIPLLYHLFEIGETVVCGLPDLDMAADKWREDILPVIAASRYRDLLPTRGAGSRGGGNFIAVEFGNGATLRFMSGGGNDKRRAGFTARALVATEIDGMDTASKASREADPLAQLEARLLSHGSRAVVYGECTVSVEDGRIWQELTKGTASRIGLPCPHCGVHVTPEREHLQGWQGADDVIAAEAALFTCPECKAPWSEAERHAANAVGRLVHRGQEITPDGQVVGPLPATRTLGFRFSAINNLFLRSGELGAAEWDSKHGTREDADESNAEKKMCQFYFAMPFVAPESDLSAFSVAQICARANPAFARGMIPPGTVYLAVGIDVGKYVCHWTATAFDDAAGPHVVDYGVIAVESAALGFEAALLAALRQFRDEVLETGWAIADGECRKPDDVIVDSGWQRDGGEIYPVYTFVSESQKRTAVVYFASKGYAASRFRMPSATASGVLGRGEQCHVKSHLVAAGDVAGRRVPLLEFDADHWKTWLHNRIRTPRERPGGFGLFAGQVRDHYAYARQMTAEKREEEFVPGKGKLVRWVQVGSKNHHLDSTVMPCVGASLRGLRLLAASPPAARTAPRPPGERRDPWAPRAIRM